VVVADGGDRPLVVDSWGAWPLHFLGRLIPEGHLPVYGAAVAIPVPPATFETSGQVLAREQLTEFTARSDG
jgi:hypothetical protein